MAIILQTPFSNALPHQRSGGSASCWFHYNDVIMSTIASQITSLTIVYSTVYLGADQRKHQSSASLAFVRGIHRGPVNSPHKGPVTRKMLPFDDVIMCCFNRFTFSQLQCVMISDTLYIKTFLRENETLLQHEYQGWFYVCSQPMRDGVTL